MLGLPLDTPVRRYGLLSVAIGGFMVQMAMGPVSAMLPTLSHSFGAEFALVSWVQTAYILCMTGVILVCGRLGDQYGHRRVFVTGVAVFALGSLLSGVSPSVQTLIASRAMQGFGAGISLGNGLAIVTNIFPSRERGRAIGIVMMSASLGSTIGVAMAVAFLQLASWRWMFVSLALVGSVGVWASLAVPGQLVPQKKHNLDFWGAATLFVLLFVFSLSLNHLHGGEASFQAGFEYHTTMQLAALVLFGLFIWIETRAEEPILVLEVLKQGRFSFPLLGHFILHFSMMGAIFATPFVIENGFGLTATFTAVFLVSRQVFTVAAAPIGGWLYDKTRSPLICPISMACIAATLATLGIFAPVLTFESLVLIGVPSGSAVGLFMAANNTFIMENIPPSLKGMGTGLLETARQMGHGTAVAISTAVMGLAIGQNLDAAVGSAAYLQGFQNAALMMSVFAFIGFLASAAVPFRGLHLRLPSTELVPGSGQGPEPAAALARTKVD